MNLLGNIIWLLCCGLVSSLSWLFVGLLWSVTIIGLPVGMQCFKIAGFVLWPFGKEISYSNMGAGSLILNVLWIIFGGIELAIVSICSGLLLCVTIIGIPFAMQSFKMAKLSLMPFGARII